MVQYLAWAMRRARKCTDCARNGLLLRRVSRTDDVTGHRDMKTEGRPADRDIGAAPRSDSTQQVPTDFRTNLYWRAGILIVCAVVVAFIIGLFAGYSGRETALATFPKSSSMKECMTNTLSLLELKQPPTPELLRQVVEYCYSLIRSQSLLKDFEIRELNFVQQYRANSVLMWMVVAVTLSGVVLAGIQLMASYQLAGSNKGSLDSSNEITIERNKLVLKSSITGLFILLLSFGFFLVFIFYVYRFERLDDSSVRGQQPIPTLPMGGLGSPPMTKGP
jgi:hypothetical protein